MWENGKKCEAICRQKTREQKHIAVRSYRMRGGVALFVAVVSLWAHPLWGDHGTRRCLKNTCFINISSEEIFSEFFTLMRIRNGVRC